MPWLKYLSPWSEHSPQLVPVCCLVSCSLFTSDHRVLEDHSSLLSHCKTRAICGSEKCNKMYSLNACIYFICNILHDFSIQASGWPSIELEARIPSDILDSMRVRLCDIIRRILRNWIVKNGSLRLKSFLEKRGPRAPVKTRALQLGGPGFCVTRFLQSFKSTATRESHPYPSFVRCSCRLPSRPFLALLR